MPNPILPTRGIRDPIHGYIEVPEEVVHVLDHPMIQRLRAITDSGLASHVYPGLNGSEFSHALGCMHLAAEVWQKVEQSSPEMGAFLEDVRTEVSAHVTTVTSDGEMARHLLLAVRLLALLRNVGSPPFGHTLDRFMNERPELFIGGIEGPTDEMLAPLRIGPQMVSIEQIVSRLIRKELSSDCPDELRVAWWLVHRVDSNTPSGHWTDPLRSLVQGGISVHRLDYLRRDALYAGTAEFGAIDLDRLVRSFFLANRSGWYLAIHIRARSAIEGFIHQRVQFQRWIHHHSHVAIIDSYFENAVETAFDLSKQKNDLGRAASSWRPDLRISSLKHQLDVTAGSAPSQADDTAVVEWLRKVNRSLNPTVDTWKSQYFRALFKSSIHRVPNWASVWNNELEYRSVAEAVAEPLKDMCETALEIIDPHERHSNTSLAAVITELELIRNAYANQENVAALNALSRLLFAPQSGRESQARNLRDFNESYNNYEVSTAKTSGRWVFVYTTYNTVADILGETLIGNSEEIQSISDVFPVLEEAAITEGRIERFYATFLSNDDDRFRRNHDHDALVDHFVSRFPIRLRGYLMARLPKLRAS